MGEEQIIFYFFAASVLISALCVVVMKNLVRSIFLFFVTLFSLAALYLFALADFIALAQVVIYAGGVLVLMLFAFMLSNRELLNSLKPTNSGFKVNHFSGILISLLFLGILFTIINRTDLNQLDWMEERVPINASDNTTHQIGIQTMTTYLLPFEILSVFLMMALIGAAHLARKGGKGMIPIAHFMLISASLFCIGLYAVLTRRNAIQVLIGIEFMINAAVLNFVAFGRYDKIAGGGQMFALFAIVLAAAGVAVALAIILNVYKYFKSIDPTKTDTLKD